MPKGLWGLFHPIYEYIQVSGNYLDSVNTSISRHSTFRWVSRYVKLLIAIIVIVLCINYYLQVYVYVGLSVFLNNRYLRKSTHDCECGNKKHNVGNRLKLNILS